MAKSAKMRVVKNNRKRGKNDSENGILRLILMPFILIFNILGFFWNLLFHFPGRPSYFLGFIRLIIWAFILFNINLSEITAYFSDRNLDESQYSWMSMKLFMIPISFLMCVYSIFIMFGVNSNTTHHGGYNDYTNIDTMTQLIDGRLSSPGNRSRILKKLFDE